MPNTNREKENLGSNKSQKSTTDSSFKNDVSNSSFSGSRNEKDESGIQGHETGRTPDKSGYQSPGSKSDTGMDERSSSSRHVDVEPSRSPDLGRERSGSRMDKSGHNEH